MESEIQQLIESQLITPETGTLLKKLAPGHCCRHKSWGAGIIKSWDAVSAKMTVDFSERRGHVMEMEYAALSLRPLEDDHIEAKILRELDQMKGLSVTDPVAVMAVVVSSMGRLATIERIEMVLSGTVVPKADWKKWWDAAKKAMKKDGRFEVPSRRNVAIGMHDKAPDRAQLSLDLLQRSNGPKEILSALEELNRNWKGEAGDVTLVTVLKEVDRILDKLPSSQTRAGIELVLARQELVAKQPGGNPLSGHTLNRFLSKNPREFVSVLEGLPSAKQGRVVEFARQAWKDDWETLAPRLLAVGNAKVCEVVIETYRDAGKFSELLAVLERLISERKLHYDFIHWLCKNRKDEFRPLINHNILSAMLSVLELEQLGGSRKASKLERLLLTDKSLLKDLLESATEEQVRDATRAILSTPAFEDLDKRSLLAAFVKLYPAVQEMITKSMSVGGESRSASAETQSVLIVSWESLRRRQAELEELVTKKIPENSREIAVARSYGDLKENHEFKSAKEMQNVLMRRKAELEIDLASAQGTDFRNAATERVGVGTVVTLKDSSDGRIERYTILGAWDSDPANNIMSYKTGIAQAMMQKAPGDEAVLPMEQGGTRTMIIEKIEPFKSV
ncbi:MAG: GreA/GreB family elongation factor [Candidatus Methylacidiphilales bacterium]